MDNEKRGIALKKRLDGLTYKAISSELGISRQRVQQLLSPPKYIRDVIVRRANGECQRCGIKVGKSGHVHHAGTEYEDYNDVENLQLLCISCHRLIHSENIVKREINNEQVEAIRLFLPLKAAKVIGIEIRQLWCMVREGKLTPVWRSYTRRGKEINVHYFLSPDIMAIKSEVERLKRKARESNP